MFKPIIYLIAICLVLSPITIVLILQTFNFYRKSNILSSLSLEDQEHITSQALEYQIANIYIDKKLWDKAIITLEGAVKSNKYLDDDWSARYYNAIGFALEKTQCYQLAKAYYYCSCRIYPEYTSAIDNLSNINRLYN
uniref:hypothetical protein ycf37 n=1 Tax=Nemalion vermiculare TaxID=935621 RepID=UPI00257B1940|nr:hypothetical protein ycf37 [Nemalion vermiculare]WGV34420.1 hypothetical protein ycf37 [Nemalion vermiculare]